MKDITIRSFCENIEYYVTRSIPLIDREGTAGFWCDGISIEGGDEVDNFIDERIIKGKAWLGRSGQEEYDAIIHLGHKTWEYLSSEDGEFRHCLPQSPNEENLIVNLQEKTLEVYLD